MAVLLSECQFYDGITGQRLRDFDSTSSFALTEDGKEYSPHEISAGDSIFAFVYPRSLHVIRRLSRSPDPGIDNKMIPPLETSIDPSSPDAPSRLLASLTQFISDILPLQRRSLICLSQWITQSLLPESEEFVHMFARNLASILGRLLREKKNEPTTTATTEEAEEEKKKKQTRKKLMMSKMSSPERICFELCSTPVFPQLFVVQKKREEAEEEQEEEGEGRREERQSTTAPAPPPPHLSHLGQLFSSSLGSSSSQQHSQQQAADHVIASSHAAVRTFLASAQKQYLLFSNLFRVAKTCLEDTVFSTQKFQRFVDGHKGEEEEEESFVHDDNWVGLRKSLEEGIGVGVDAVEKVRRRLESLKMEHDRTMCSFFGTLLETALFSLKRMLAEKPQLEEQMREIEGTPLKQLLFAQNLPQVYQSCIRELLRRTGFEERFRKNRENANRAMIAECTAENELRDQFLRRAESRLAGNRIPEELLHGVYRLVRFSSSSSSQSASTESQRGICGVLHGPSTLRECLRALGETETDDGEAQQQPNLEIPDPFPFFETREEGEEDEGEDEENSGDPISRMGKEELVRLHERLYLALLKEQGLVFDDREDGEEEEEEDVSSGLAEKIAELQKTLKGVLQERDQLRNHIKEAIAAHRSQLQKATGETKEAVRMSQRLVEKMKTQAKTATADQEKLQAQHMRKIEALETKLINLKRQYKEQVMSARAALESKEEQLRKFRQEMTGLRAKEAAENGELQEALQRKKDELTAQIKLLRDLKLQMETTQTEAETSEKKRVAAEQKYKRKISFLKNEIASLKAAFYQPGRQRKKAIADLALIDGDTEEEEGEGEAIVIAPRSANVSIVPRTPDPLSPFLSSQQQASKGRGQGQQPDAEIRTVALMGFRQNDRAFFSKTSNPQVWEILRWSGDNAPQCYLHPESVRYCLGLRRSNGRPVKMIIGTILTIDLIERKPGHPNPLGLKEDYYLVSVDVEKYERN